METTSKRYKCSICKDYKAPEFFYLDSGRRTGLMNRCKDCDKIKSNEKYIKRQINLKKFIRSYKTLPCFDCKIQYPYYVMDFDHRPGSNKLFELSDFQNKSIRQLRLEASKCDVVCSNCHRKRTNSRRVS